MCATYGHVLGKPGGKQAAENAIQRHFAESCDSFGKSRPDTGPERPMLAVAAPDPNVIVGGLASEDERKQVTSCNGCANLITDKAVVRDVGWPTGLCAAQGRLILQHRTALEARGCDWRRPGSNRDNMDGMILMPVYDDAFGVGADPIKKFLKTRGKPVVDPRDYKTDKPVDEHDEKAGIRAWRRIESTDGSGRYTHLPIFRTDLFDDREQQKIPRTGDDEMPEHYVDHMGAVYKVAVLLMELDETPALWGQAGTGKTEFGRHLAWLMNCPFDRISITESTEVDDVIGSMRARKVDSYDASGEVIGSATETYFHYGRIPQRWQKPGVLLLDEPNTGGDAVWQRIRPLTDNSKQMVLDENENERIARDDFCFLLMAMNPAWDVRNIGARPLADADGNRLMHLTFVLPPEEIERAILQDRCSNDGYDLPKPIEDALMKIALDVRQAADDETLPISWGVRPMIKTARATRWFDLLTCFKIAVADSLDPEAAAFVLEIVKGYVDPETGDLA